MSHYSCVMPDASSMDPFLGATGESTKALRSHRPSSPNCVRARYSSVSDCSARHYGATFGGMGMIIETRSLYRR
jgi:hypothetical protein